MPSELQAATAARRRETKSPAIPDPTEEQIRKLGGAIYESVRRMSPRDAGQLAHHLYEFVMQSVPYETTPPLYILADMANARSKA